MIHTWEKDYEFRSGKWNLSPSDPSVRLVGPTLETIIWDIASRARYGSIADVVLTRSTISGWKAVPAEAGKYSWANILRRPRSASASEPNGIIAILIGLLLPASQLGAAEEQAFRVLKPYLTPEARLWVAPDQQTSNGFHANDVGFQGGVFVQTR
jgi:hypothetical protein